MPFLFVSGIAWTFAFQFVSGSVDGATDCNYSNAVIREERYYELSSGRRVLLISVNTLSGECPLHCITLVAHSYDVITAVQKKCTCRLFLFLIYDKNDCLGDRDSTMYSLVYLKMVQLYLIQNLFYMVHLSIELDVSYVFRQGCTLEDNMDQALATDTLCVFSCN